MENKVDRLELKLAKAKNVQKRQQLLTNKVLKSKYESNTNLPQSVASM